MGAPVPRPSRERSSGGTARQRHSVVAECAYPAPRQRLRLAPPRGAPRPSAPLFGASLTRAQNVGTPGSATGHAAGARPPAYLIWYQMCLLPRMRTTGRIDEGELPCGTESCLRPACARRMRAGPLWATRLGCARCHAVSKHASTFGQCDPGLPEGRVGAVQRGVADFAGAACAGRLAPAPTAVGDGPGSDS